MTHDRRGFITVPLDRCELFSALQLGLDFTWPPPGQNEWANDNRRLASVNRFLAGSGGLPLLVPVVLLNDSLRLAKRGPKAHYTRFRRKMIVANIR